MGDARRVRLYNHFSAPSDVDAILADPSLLIFALPKCETCDGHGMDYAPNADRSGGMPRSCLDCGGVGYTPHTAIPTRIVDEWAEVVRVHGWYAQPYISPEARALAEEVQADG